MPEDEGVEGCTGDGARSAFLRHSCFEIRHDESIMRRLICACGGEVPRPLPTHCPHCGQRITRVRRKSDWLSPLVVVLLFAAVIALLIWLTWGAGDTRKRPFGQAGRGAGILACLTSNTGR